MTRFFIIFVGIFGLWAQPAAALELAWPAACSLGKDCFIQNYVDQDKGPDYRDFSCGKLSYNTHKGTDIRTRNLKAMEAGVNVLAAANGTVKAVRDRMPDRIISSPDDARVRNQECGNGLVIAHADGFETQYCHLKRGSLTVKAGETVKAGDVLGQIGLSGMTEFPHLHFEVRRDGRVLDPFTGSDEAPPCPLAATALAPMWAKSVAYLPTGVLGFGFADHKPTHDEAKQGVLKNVTLPTDAPVLVVWAELFGLRPGDTVATRFLSPEGKPLAEHRQPYRAFKAVGFQYVGVKRSAGAWPTGAYTAHLSVERGGETIAEETRTLTVQ